VSVFPGYPSVLVADPCAIIASHRALALRVEDAGSTTFGWTADGQLLLNVAALREIKNLSKRSCLIHADTLFISVDQLLQRSSGGTACGTTPVRSPSASTSRPGSRTCRAGRFRPSTLRRAHRQSLSPRGQRRARSGRTSCSGPTCRRNRSASRRRLRLPRLRKPRLQPLSLCSLVPFSTCNFFRRLRPWIHMLLFSHRSFL
jgi:hypothetical protein